MKSLTKTAVLGSGVLRMAGFLRKNGAAILMYHSVRNLRAGEFDPLGGIGHSVDVFRGQMEFLATGYRPISLDELTKTLRAGRELPRHSVAVTFDDGYADNHETVMPILDRAGMPATFYITVDCLEKERLPWPARLRLLFYATKRKMWRDPAAKDWDLDGEIAKRTAFVAACAFCCKLTGPMQDKFVASVAGELEVTVSNESDGRNPMMSGEQLNDLLRHGHVVGSHTMDHPNMAYVGREEAVTELCESKRRLEAHVGSPVTHFAYPCPALSPHWNEVSVRESAAAGYETAVTTDWGLVRSGDERLSLKRMLPSKTVEGLRWNLERAFAGIAV